MKNFYTNIKNYYFVILLIGILCSFNFKAKKEEFSGIIHYQVLYESKSPFIDAKSLEKEYGTEVTIYYSNGNYLIQSNGENAPRILYLEKTNTRYILKSGNDSAFIEHCDSTPPENIAWLARGQSSMVILGWKCKGLVMETPAGIYTYYFTDRFYVNPKPYDEHYFANFNRYLKLSHAPFLQYVFDGESYVKTLVADKLEQTSLDQKIFEPPADIVVKR